MDFLPLSLNKDHQQSPRSTVGTITEIYDFLRLLYARAADAYSYNTGEKMVSYSDEQIKTLIVDDFTGKRITILAPVIRARKGHGNCSNKSQSRDFKSPCEWPRSRYYCRYETDRYKTHDRDLVVDRMVIESTPIMKSD
jgi:excinuclease ABC subunit A